MKPKVYVAGPYTKGDVAVNVANAIFAGNVLLDEGCIPFIPHLCHFWHMIWPHGKEEWLQYGKQWLSVCDALVVLPGHSLGAMEERGYAAASGIPIYYVTEPLYDSLLGIAEKIKAAHC